MDKAQEKQNFQPMNHKEQIEFYRKMSPKQKLNLTFMFMNFGHKLEKNENPKITIDIDSEDSLD